MREEGGGGLIREGGGGSLLKISSPDGGLIREGGLVNIRERGIIRERAY